MPIEIINNLSRQQILLMHKGVININKKVSINLNEMRCLERRLIDKSV